MANTHLLGAGCPVCSGKKFNTSDFIKKSKLVHNNRYDYSLVEYTRGYEKIKIICSIHGVFEQTPNIHLCGCGCPKCKESKGEQKIREFLIQNNVLFDSQKKFKECKNKICLRFDFYLPDYNLCVEYNGEQHYMDGCFSKKKSLIYTQENDKIKRLFCEKNNINLLIIKYNEDIIEVLKRFLKI